jgi:peroxin-5
MLGVAHSNYHATTRALNCLKAWLVANPAYKGTLDLQPLEEYDELYGDADEDSAVSGPLNQELHQVVTKLFVDATKVNPHDAEVWTVIGLLYRLSGDNDLSINAFREAIKLRPDDPQMWNKLGAMITNAGGNTDEAAAAYQHALRLRPKYVRALSNLGISYYNVKRYDEAVNAFVSGLAINPEPGHLWSYVGMCFASLGREDLARIALDRDITLLQQHMRGSAPPQ